jgi:Kef-type K+ transport system membrane component KefB
MSSADFVQLLLQLAVLLGTAMACGQAMRALRQPSVMGELLGGVLLGPTLLGRLAPDAAAAVFGGSPGVATARDALTRLGLLFFLFAVGLETDLSLLKRFRRTALSVGLTGSLLPLAIGALLVASVPYAFWGPHAEAHPFAFAVFIGLNLANSAIPVLARILMDLKLLGGRIGTLCLTAAVVDDLVAWAFFAVVLVSLSPSQAGLARLPVTFALSIAVPLLVVAIGRRVGPPWLAWLKHHVPWPEGFIAATSMLLFVAAAAAETTGVHAALGALLLGVALGGGDAEHREAHDVVARFALGLFAPLYFVSLGLTTDFVRSFDAALVAVVVAAAIVSKLAGVLLGAKLAGMKLDRETWAIGFGLNARGATGIILAAVGHAAGVIDDRLFVALAVTAFLTSLIAGPAMSRLLRPAAQSDL